MSRAPLGDDWYESEPPTRIGLVTELQRIRRRFAVRPIPVIVLALLITAGVTYKFATKPVMFEANVVLALSEGVMSTRSATGVPADQLRQYVTTILLPDAKLIELVEKRDLFRLRKKLGPQFALDELRSNLSVQIWRNSFLYAEGDSSNAQRSARIGLTYVDSDPDRAFSIVQDIAAVAIQTSALLSQRLADTLSHDITILHDAISERLSKLEVEHARKQAVIDQARKRGELDVARLLEIDIAGLERDQRREEKQLRQLASNRDSLAGEIAAAGLDTSMSIVEERRPERPVRHDLVLVMIAAVIGTGALLGSALVLGAFDSRVHDTDDVARLGLPVLGHVPGFAGDNVGSMQSRSAARARVPSFLRWRSHR
jgi:hypothetical protein